MEVIMQQPLRNRVLILSLIVALALTAAAVAAAPPEAPEVSGNWTWEETTWITLPADLAAAFFGVADPKGPVVHIRCDSGGSMDLVQNGSSFSGLATQTATCATRDGQDAPTPPFPPFFPVEGDVDGRSIQFEADIGGAFTCKYRGSLSEDGGLAVGMRAAGSCDVPSPAKPNSDHIQFRATR
jgi:hypothetical protein